MKNVQLLTTKKHW